MWSNSTSAPPPRRTERLGERRVGGGAFPGSLFSTLGAGESGVNVLLAAAGGAIGASLRYLAGLRLAARLGPDFPWGTFFANVTGSFPIGVILVLVEGGSLSAGARLFPAVGVMGGPTTFSSYSHETLGLISDGELPKAFVYVSGQLLLGFFGVCLGVLAGRSLGGA